jgi:hypothetical protein
VAPDTARFVMTTRRRVARISAVRTCHAPLVRRTATCAGAVAEDDVGERRIPGPTERAGLRRGRDVAVVGHGLTRDDDLDNEHGQRAGDEKGRADQRASEKSPAAHRPSMGRALEPDTGSTTLARARPGPGFAVAAIRRHSCARRRLTDSRVPRPLLLRTRSDDLQHVE